MRRWNCNRALGVVLPALVFPHRLPNLSWQALLQQLLAKM